VDDQLGPDVRLALAAIAAELGVDADQLPIGVSGVLHAFGSARYGEGARDCLLIRTRRKTDRSFPAPRSIHQANTQDVTPVVTKHGRRRREEDGGGEGGSEPA